MKKLIEVALAEYGVTEIVGNEHNPRILQYARDLGKNFDFVTTDEIPWCSTFINWCALQSGMERTNKANARSWLDIGEVTMFPEVGDIVVFKRGNSDWQGHVGIFIAFDNNNDVFVLSGNQGNKVNISLYKKDTLLGFRRLKQIQGL